MLITLLINESINSLYQEVIKVRQNVLYRLQNWVWIWKKGKEGFCAQFCDFCEKLTCLTLLFVFILLFL